MNADPQVMRYFPSTQTQQQSDAQVGMWRAQFEEQEADRLGCHGGDICGKNRPLTSAPPGYQFSTEEKYHMSNTISWNLQLSVRDGRQNELQALMKEMVTATEQEAGALGYEWFLSADGKTCHINERYADSGAVMAHLGNFGAKFADRFLGCLEPTGLSVYGKPSAEARAALDGFGANYLGWLGGFMR